MSSNSTIVRFHPAPNSRTSCWWTTAADIGGAESCSLVRCWRYGAAISSGSAPSRMRQRLAELHRPALELAQRAEQLLGGALLHLGHHRLGGCAAESLAHAQSGATGVPERQRRQLGGARHRLAGQVGHAAIVPAGTDGDVRSARGKGHTPGRWSLEVSTSRTRSAGAGGQGWVVERLEAGLERDRRAQRGGASALRVRGQVAGGPGRREGGQRGVHGLGHAVGPVAGRWPGRTARRAAARPGRPRRLVGVDAAQAGGPARARRTGRGRRGPRPAVTSRCGTPSRTSGSSRSRRGSPTPTRTCRARRGRAALRRGTGRPVVGEREAGAPAQRPQVVGQAGADRVAERRHRDLVDAAAGDGGRHPRRGPRGRGPPACGAPRRPRVLPAAGSAARRARSSAGGDAGTEQVVQHRRRHGVPGVRGRRVPGGWGRGRGGPRGRGRGRPGPRRATGGAGGCRAGAGRAWREPAPAGASRGAVLHRQATARPKKTCLSCF